MQANNGGNEMRKEDRYNEISEIRTETSIDNNSGLFVNTNVSKYTKKEEKVLSRVQALHKRAGYIRPRLGQSASIGAQHTNTLMRSTIQLVLWLLAFVLSTMIVYFTNTNNVFNMNNGVIAVESTPDTGGTEAFTRPDANSPYEISTPMQLRYLSQNQSSYLSSSFILTADIEYTTSSWTPIGTSSSSAFTGTFDGNGHSITFTKTICITSDPSIGYAGVFGYVKGTNDIYVEIWDLGVNWAGTDQIDGYTGLVIYSYTAYAGGLVGYADSYTTISNCYNTGAVSASSNAYAGGIAGYVNSSIIRNCYNTGSVSVATDTNRSSTRAGGISGYADSSIINNCYNIGLISATASSSAYAGGITGQYGTISNCFSIGTAPSGTTLGAIVGNGGTVNYCYHNYSSISTATTGTAIIYNKNLADLVLQESTFTGGGLIWYDDGTDTYDWNFTNTWIIDGSNDGYPYLRAFIKKYTVTYDYLTNGGNSASLESATIDMGSQADLTATAIKEDGWTFVGWNTVANAQTALTSYTPTGDVTLYAIFSKTIIVNFYQLGVTTPTSQTQTIYNKTENYTFTAPSVTTNGINGTVTQTGWTTTAGSEAINYATSDITLSDSVDLYAVVKYNVTITYKANGGIGSDVVTEALAVTQSANKTVTPNSYNANATLIANPFTKQDYSFVGWATSSGATSGISAGEKYPLNSNTTLYAVWESNYVGVTFNITTNVGVIFNVYDSNNNFVQQIYVAKGDNTQIVNTQLLKGKTYTIKMSANYTTSIVSASGATQQGRELSLIISDSGNTITMTIKGYAFGNGIIV